MNSTFAESVVEDAALALIESVGWSVRHGAVLAPGRRWIHGAGRLFVGAV